MYRGELQFSQNRAPYLVMVLTSLSSFCFVLRQGLPVLMLASRVLVIQACASTSRYDSVVFFTVSFIYILNPNSPPLCL